MSVPGSASPLFLAAAAAAAPAGPQQIDRSLRFNSSDSAFLSRTPSSTGSRSTWTYSCWVKRTAFGGYPRMFGTYDSSYIGWDIEFKNDNRLEIHYSDDGSNYPIRRITSAVYRDPSAWMHVVVAVDLTVSGDNSVRLYVNGSEVTDFDTKTNSGSITNTNINTATEHRIGYNYSYSDFYLTEVHFVDGTQLAATDFGFEDSNKVWQPKAFSGTYGTNGFYLKCADNSSIAALGTDSSGNSNTWTVNNLTPEQFSPTATTTGDPTSSTDSPFSSGYSVDFDGNDAIRFTGPGTITGDFTAECFVKSSSYGGTQRIFSADQAAQSGERLNLRCYNGNTEFYVASGVSASGTNFPTNQWNHIAITRSGSTVSYYLNGSRWATDTYSSSFDVTTLVVAHGYGSEYFTGKVSNARFVDGQALYTGASYTQPTSTLTTTSQGATAANVRLICCHQSSVTATQGTISAGSGNDSLLDTPTNYAAASGNNAGNYATLNPLAPSGLTLSNGNLDGSGSVIQGHTPSTIFASSGKFYCEFTLTTYQNDTGVGVAASIANPDEDWIGEQAYMIGYLADGRIFQNSSSTSYSSYAAGDVIGAAFDADTGKVWFHKNGTYQNSGNPAAGTGQVGTITGGYALGFTFRSVGGAGSFNFGQRAFAYTPPTGYVSLCTENLSESAYASIPDGSTAFDVDTWSGDGTDPRSRTLSFGPDIIWVKTRNQTNWNYITDSVRGAPNKLYTNDSGTEDTAPIYGQIDSLNTDGFTLGGGTHATDDLSDSNKSGTNYVAWAWDAGTSTVSNTDGSVTSNVRASQANGCSVVTWNGTASGQTVGHGLGAAAPEFIIVKARDQNQPWVVYHSALGRGGVLQLHRTDANITTYSEYWGTAEPSSTVFGTYTGAHPWANNYDDMVAYCFAPVEGFSAFGSYTGNGDTGGDGTFVYTGMRPKFVLIKASSISQQNWYILDAARDPYNLTANKLEPNTNNAENTSPNTATTNSLDLLSNGFKLRTNNDGTNKTSTTYIYAAFAEHPLRTARAR